MQKNGHHLSLKKTSKKIRGYWSRLLWFGKPKVTFGLLRDKNVVPLIEEMCQFRFSDRIFIGKNVSFLRGCVVLADPNGLIKIEDNSTICRFAIVQSVGGKIQIGRDTVIGDFCSLYGQGSLLIGNDVMLASGVRVVPNAHSFASCEIPIRCQPCRSSGIVIEDDVWVGTNAVILDGVEIGEGSVIGAGAVVTKSVPAGSVVVGVPGRVVRSRLENNRAK
jgi:acetyltransferase-like isoleucine patch superfamily enzyme